TDRLRASNSISVTEAETRAAETRISAARVEELAVQLKQAEEILERHVVVAPFAGVISRKLTEAGEWVATGTPVLELVSTGALRVDVRVPQQRFARLRSDTPVRILAVDGSGATTARVVALVPVGDVAARTFLARVEPTDPAALTLVPGMAATVEFELLSDEIVLAVPRDALVRRPDGTTNLWLARREGDRWSATQRRIEVGRRFASSVEIRGGVQPGDLVVIRGNETLREGQPIVFAGRES
ncbi:MAG: efflux RND transporter periplasmic adaptor subunit, partial [Cephaloticoccus sp.]|nr:efflux RND transporter periplasmic adaptor subunit [Cephaloticoccus sp.]